MSHAIALTDADAADALGVSLTVFRQLREEGHLPKARRVPGRRRNLNDLEELRTAFRCWQREGQDIEDDEDEGEDW